VIGSTRQVAVYACARAVDMRKSFDTLAALVKAELRREVLSGDVYVFVGKTRRRAKVLYWDGTGLCLFAKRLEKGRFAAPWERGAEGPLRWTMSELSLFLEGSELVGRIRLSPEPWMPARHAVLVA
jgi:transposase